MVTLLSATKSTEKSLRESLHSIVKQAMPLISTYVEQYQKDKNSLFNHVQNVTHLHENPILRNTKGKVIDNNTYEIKGGNFLKKSEIQEFYDNGFISHKYRFPHFSEKDIQRVKEEFITYNNKCQDGTYEPAYRKFPDYVGHLYLPSVVKLFHDNYDFIVQKSMSIFNKPEEELFFSVGVFLIDDTEKGINLHQDYSYYFLDQTSPHIDTSLITFHTSITNHVASKFCLFPKTHKEILHNLPTLKYIRDHNINIDAALAMYSGCIAEYILNDGPLPYNSDAVLLHSHFSRYPQIIYILDKYKDNDVKGFEVSTKPGEFLLFDPAILHSNGADPANMDEMVTSFEKKISEKNIARLSLAIRVMHTKNAHGHLLWMSAPEKIEVAQKFFNDRCQENKPSLPKHINKVNLNKNGPEFYTVLSNNKLSSPDSPYFSVEEMYQIHAQSGAYQEKDLEDNLQSLCQASLI